MLYTFHARNAGFYQSLSAKRALGIFLGLQAGDRRLGTHRAARFAMAFENHGNATSVACWLEMLEADADAGSKGSREPSAPLNIVAITHMRYSVTTASVPHVSAPPRALRQQAQTRGIASRILGWCGGRLMHARARMAYATGCHIL